MLKYNVAGVTAKKDVDQISQIAQFEQNLIARINQDGVKRYKLPKLWIEKDIELQIVLSTETKPRNPQYFITRSNAIAKGEVFGLNDPRLRVKPDSSGKNILEFNGELLQGDYGYVIDDKGSLIIFSRKLKHSVAAAGEDVVAAGAVYFIDGKIYSFNTNSGHYLPMPLIGNMGIREFNEQGRNLFSWVIENLNMARAPGVPEGSLWRPYNRNLHAPW